MAQVRSFLSLFRVFLPSWKFFDQAGAMPDLYYQVESSGWQPALIAPRLRFWNLFINPEGSFHHAFHSMVQRLLLDANEMAADQIEESVSYRLVENLVRFQILRRSPTASGLRFQFKITVLHPEHGDALISKEHEV